MGILRSTGANPAGPMVMEQKPPAAGIMRWDENEHGVCLGIYANQQSNRSRLFGEQTSLFRELIQYGEERGVDVVILTPGCVQTHQGWRYNDAHGGWYTTSVPLPHVVYRRSGSFRNVPDKVIREDLNYFHRLKRLHSLPRSCSNKWKFYRTMRTQPRIRSYLLATEVAQTPHDILGFLDRYQDVYIKPIYGAQGSMIHRLERRDGSVVATWERRMDIYPARGSRRQDLRKTIMERHFDSEMDFEEFWGKHGLPRCLVQESICLPRTSDGRPFDFRWLIQRTDQLQVIARVARVGTQHSITTNIHTGGQARPAEDIVAECFGNKASEVLVDIDDAALQIAGHLEELYGSYAEVGIDLALLDSGEVVVFEVNPTPGRRMLRSLPGNVRQMSLRRLIEYAIRATGISMG